MHHFSSSAVAASRRMQVVNDTTGDWSEGRLTWEPVNSVDFAVEMSRTQLGRATFSVQRSTGVSLVNRPDIAPERPSCFIHAALQGAQDLEVDGAHIRLEEGEYTLTHAARSFVRQPGDDILVACLAAPVEIMQRYTPDPEKVVGHVFAAEGLTGSVARILRSMLEMDQNGTLDDFGGRVSLHALDLFGLCSQALDSESEVARDDRLHRIKAFVRQNIHVPELSVAGVAERFQISTRYVHMLFANENTSLSNFIRQERLERCRVELEDSKMRSRSISELAYAWGFNDLSNFCRTFKRTYGMSARDYRIRALNDGVPAYGPPPHNPSPQRRI